MPTTNTANLSPIPNTPNTGAAELAKFGAGQIALRDGNLFVGGTNQRDTIRVDRGDNGAYNVMLNGKQHSYPGEDVNRVIIRARGGDDAVQVGEGVDNVHIMGGRGNDTIDNKAKGAKIRGGRGDDWRRGCPAWRGGRGGVWRLRMPSQRSHPC